MARPKLGKGESERLQMVISSEELEAIEDWRFRNRVQSKSEAIRRLCQIGKDMEEVIPNATDHADDMLSAVRLLYVLLDTSARAMRDGGKIDLEEIIGRTEDLLDRAEDLHLILMRENNRIVPLADRKGIKAAIAEATASEDEMTDFINAYIAGGDDHRESRIMRQVMADLSPDERAQYRTMEPERQVMFWKMKTGLKRMGLYQAKQGEEDTK